MRMPSTRHVVPAIGRVTFLEIIRDKLLFSVLFLAFLLLGLSLLAAKITFLRPGRLVLDLGLMGVSLTSLLIGVFVGSSLIAREFERRTISLILSHPISRVQFLLGKFLGMVFAISANWILLVGAYFLILFFYTTESADFNRTLLFSVVLAWVQALVITSVVFLFSSFTTTTLSAIFSLCVFLIGQSVVQIQVMASQLPQSWLKWVLGAVARVWPNFDWFNLGFKVTYGLPVSWTYFLGTCCYGFCLVGFFLLIAGVVIQGKEV
ncbi:MAG: ABC transporter permease [Bdellovibrionia bacterium]